MTHAIYVGTIGHERFIPKHHSFSYPFFMWFLDLDTLNETASLGRWFSATHWALSMFVRSDYLGAPETPLAEVVRKRMEQLTGHPVTGKVYGLMNLRCLGLFFSPVNFYYGYDNRGKMTHLLAEVSNIPWNERHHYGHYVGENKFNPTHPKAFHVSPFNPMDQTYTWNIGIPGKKLSLNLGVHDGRGHIFEAKLRLERHPFTRASVKKQLLRKPVLTAYIVAGIYWQALKLYRKGVPYIPYEKEMT